MPPPVTPLRPAGLKTRTPAAILAPRTGESLGRTRLHDSPRTTLTPPNSRYPLPDLDSRGKGRGRHLRQSPSCARVTWGGGDARGHIHFASQLRGGATVRSWTSGSKDRADRQPSPDRPASARLGPHRDPQPRFVTAREGSPRSDAASGSRVGGAGNSGYAAGFPVALFHCGAIRGAGPVALPLGAARAAILWRSNGGPLSSPAGGGVGSAHARAGGCGRSGRWFVVGGLLAGLRAPIGAD